ncbi:MAG: hypothetical protein JWM30_197 [Burkholderia sp.]|nr:hypothetical protein [Burkholderia sp.]
MQKVSCPSCGAPLAFKSHASVMAICDYCKSTVIKDAEAVRDIGKMSAVLEDYSPLQVGTSGTFGGQSFTLIGRIQLRYDAGLWNEWNLMFDDGRTGWLSESGGQYTLTLEKEVGQALPPFGELHASATYQLLGQIYTAADVRSARCTGGEGELPFRVGAGWQARTADLRSSESFITLDYSDGEVPRVYAGQSVTLEQLKCQLLRDEASIKDSAYAYRKKVQALNCPSCGHSIQYVPGLTRQLVCPACRVTIDANTDIAAIDAAAERMKACETTLELGAKAAIDGKPFQLIGALKRRDGEGSTWTEYLLYESRAGFLWLIETDEGWWRAKVHDDWPLWNGGGELKSGSLSFTKVSEYDAQVLCAVGAFNWQVKAGDAAHVLEFESGKNRLAAEYTAEEMTWTWAAKVGADQIRAWFGGAIEADKLPAKTSVDTIARYFLWGLLGFNFIPLMFQFDRTWHYSAFGAAAIWLPAKIMRWMQE